jgi:hypothetical protein
MNLINLTAAYFTILRNTYLIADHFMAVENPFFKVRLVTLMMSAYQYETR